MTSKIPFLSLLPGECMSRYFFENFLHVCKANTSTAKVHFKNLQFTTGMFDMGVLNFAFDVVLCLSNFSKLK